MPTRPWANDNHTSLRSVVPGLGWVSPARSLYRPAR
jgi:hypothetical protein